MRFVLGSFAGAAILSLALPASAAVIHVSPADGPTAYTKIEGAGPGDEVIIAPGTYAFRVYLEGQGTASQPIHIHAEDPSNPPVWDPAGQMVDDLPGSYTAGDKARGCWQVSGGSNYVIEGLVLRNCRGKDNDSAGLRYYAGTTGLVLRSVVFDSNDNGLTGGTEDSDATVEFCEFTKNGNLKASTSAPTHNAYIYAGLFTLRYSYLHDPVQGQNLHCRARASTIEYNWFDRAKSYVGDLMTSDDYANNPVGSLQQTMTLRGNVILQGSGQNNTGQLWAVYNDEASGSPVSFSVTALYNTVVGAGAHAAFIHLSNADGTQMTAHLSNNIISGTSQPVLIEDKSKADASGSHNWIQTGADGTGLSGSITGASPGFNGAASDDFTLAAGSACLGAADTSVTGLPTEEYFQNEVVTRMYRDRAAAKDVGAFEHDTTGPGMGPGGSMGTSSSSGSTGTGGSTTGPGSSSSSGSMGTGGSVGTGGMGTGGAATPGKSSGCSCSTAGGEESMAALWAIGLAVGVGLRRRRGIARG